MDTDVKNKISFSFDSRLTLLPKIRVSMYHHISVYHIDDEVVRLISLFQSPFHIHSVTLNFQ